MMDLTAGDRSSSVWMKLSVHLHERLRVLQARLESDADLDSTNRARGAIAEIRAILKANEEPARIEPDTQMF